MWIAHDMSPQKFLGYFIADIQHKTLPDILQVRLFIFKDSTSPTLLLPYAPSIRLGIIEFKVPSETPSIALDAMTYAIKHVTFSTPLHSFAQKWTCSKSQCNHTPLKPAIKLHSFQDHHFPDYSSKKKTSHFRTIFHKKHHFSSFLLKTIIPRPFAPQINKPTAFFSKSTIPCKVHHSATILPNIKHFRTICHQNHHSRTSLLKINHFRTISPLIMFTLL